MHTDSREPGAPGSGPEVRDLELRTLAPAPPGFWLGRPCPAQGVSAGHTALWFRRAPAAPNGVGASSRPPEKALISGRGYRRLTRAPRKLRGRVPTASALSLSGRARLARLTAGQVRWFGAVGVPGGDVPPPPLR